MPIVFVLETQDAQFGLQSVSHSLCSWDQSGLFHSSASLKRSQLLEEMSFYVDVLFSVPGSLKP